MNETVHSQAPNLAGQVELLAPAPHEQQAGEGSVFALLR